MLSACMQHHWNYCQDLDVKAHKRQHQNGTESPLRPSLNRVDGTTPQNSTWSPPEGIPAVPIDPPPLEDNLAKHIVHVMSRFIYQIGILDEKEYGIVANHSASACSTEAYTSFNGQQLPTSLMVNIYRAASRVVAYVSSSNWSSTFAKIKNRISYLTTTQEENPEVTDVMLLECASLNCKRLSMVLTELCSSALHLRKAAQLFIAVMLRRAIWNWIENYTAEFTLLCHNQTRIDGSPEILFDIFNSLADTTKRKAIFWPVQTMLLVLCPDIMISQSLSGGRVQNKKASSSQMKAMKGDRMGELAAICYVDLCRAATYVSKDDMTAIRQVVPDVENELIEKLFDIHRPADVDSLSTSLGVYIDHRSLMADCIVAMFRLDTQKTISSLIPTCFDHGAPTIFKLSVVKAAVAIASEVDSLPWIPSISELYIPLCTRIRKLFLEFYTRDLKADSNSQHLSVSSRKTLATNLVDKRSNRKDARTAAQERFELILDVLRLYQTDPKLAIQGEAEDGFDQNAALMLAITNCLRDQSACVRDAAAECLYKLHAPDNIILWGPPDKFMESFWKISSQVLFTLAKQLLDNRERESGLRKLLDLLKRLLTSRNKFLEKHRDTATFGIDTRERLQASIGLEVALLVLLCSYDTDICTLSIDCFSLLCTEVHLTERLDDLQPSSITIVENISCYTELTSHSGVVTGRKSQQRRIRRLLRMINHSSPGMLAAWEEAWKRWKLMTPLVVRTPDDSKDDGSFFESNNKKHGGSTWHDKLRNTSSRQLMAPTSSSTRLDMIDDDRSSEWQNYAGFLAALGGVCLMTESSVSPSTRLRPNDSPSYSKHILAPVESVTMVDKFVMDMVDLLACDNLIVREWVREILGNDLSPALYHIMFRHLENTLTKCFGPDNSDPICNPRYTLFVEQAISVLKQVLDRLSEKTDNLFTVDFSTLINQYALYLNKLGTNQLSIKIKIKMCQLVEVLMSKKDSVTLRQEFKLKNKLLEIIVEWTSDFSLKPDSISQSSNYEASQVDKLQNDLDIACLRTIVALLHHLPLQPSEPVVESDALAIKSRIFYKYFTYFFKLLNRCRVSEIEHLQTRSYDSQFRTGSELAPLKNYTILALSNLLSANVDAGLKYSFSMGYHEDTRTRSAFMEVLTNILNQGTEFETLAETVMTDRYEKLIDMLVQSDLRIVLSLCEVCPSSDIDDVANALLACFASRNKTMSLLKAVIEREVETTENEADLFRKTSIATRLLSVYAKNNGADYVRSVLLPVFQKLSERPREDRCFELDPTKIGPDEDVNKNRNNVVEATELFLNAICDSVNDSPQSFREICHCILTSVREQFPEAKYTAVGSFIFLRFFCPAIVSPETEGLIKNTVSISREMRRGFLIATKVIQNLANNVLFGAKETYMIVLNDFLTSNIYRVASFLREIAKVPAETSTEEVVELPQMNEKSYAMIHRVLADNIERISRDMASRHSASDQDQDSVNVWKRDFDKFANLLAQLGRPPEIPHKESMGPRSYVYAASNQLYADFVRRNSHRSVEVIVSKNIFYEGGVSKAGRPVFYLITRHINADNIDFELLIYHVLQTLERASNRHYELVIDSTRFCRLNEIPGQWVHQLVQILSEDKSDNIAVCHIFNPNTYLRTFIQKLARPLLHKFAKRIVFAVTLAELHEYIFPAEIRLPQSTIGLETDPSAVFSPVNKILKYTAHLAVTFKVSAEYVQIMAVRKQEIFYGLNAVTNDICHISEIEDIGAVHHERSSSDTSQEFSYRCTRENIVLTFTSPKKEAIINTIRHSKRRYDMSRPASISERTIQPSDVPGRLLNMALLNLGSDDPNLRLSSYNLLYALSIVFNFDVGKQLLDAKDLCLPANSTEFIVNISEKIAATEPSLTLEFLNECVLGYGKSEQGLRYLCLLYMIPWLPNLSLYCGRSTQDTVKTKELLRLLIDLTLTGEMSKLIQAKIWKTIAKVDDILNLVIDTFILVSNEHGVGSMQAEALADTLVTLSNVTVRSKLTSYLRKIIHRTSFKPTRSLTDHPSWPEIAILVRFVLMLSFNNRGPVKRVVPELFHIVSLIAGVGSTVMRASVHGIVVNMIQSLCTSMPLSAANVKKLQLLLIELSESKSRLLFGLNRSNANAFTITPETLNDTVEPISLLSLESIVSKLSEVINYAAPTADIANFWRARWMSLVASTAFQFNPAVQPRAFIVLGYLGREEIDDDLLYQILVALRGALAIFSDSDPNLVTSIMMCLKNVVESLPGDSRYLLQLFWVAVALVEINTGPTFAMAVELLQAVVRALDSNGIFAGDTMIDVLLAARGPVADVARQLDNLCGVNFESHFSFAIAGIFMKGLRYNDVKDAIYHGLHTFLDIERKQFPSDGLSEESSIIETSTLGYVAGLLPLAAKNEAVKDLLKIAGLTETDIDSHIINGKTYAGIFDKFDIPDNTTALLLISLLANMLNTADNESERLFIYGLLSEAANAIPEVFSLIYDSLLPKMNQIMISSQTQAIIESVKSILLTACSDPVFTESKNKPTQRALLEQLGFSALDDPTFGASSTNVFQNAKLASELMERIIS
ncbi:hypothetical protein BD408DRAFT_358792 [Parasitella parasitica]|nr:hypothetical protein BD408DRAFT_358792 [Parasitella parasitica]